MSFKQLNLHPRILNALEQLGYETPTPVQAEAIPKVLEGHDLIASAQTGTGKTAAFVLPALQLFIRQKRPNKAAGTPAALILTPTRELANQVNMAMRRYGRFMRFTSVSLVGGMSYSPQIKQLSKSVDVIIATPGRLIDHINQKRVDLSHLNMLVLDEADRMLDMGFIDEVERIASLSPKNRQTLMFTATWDGKMAKLAQNLLNNPQRVQVAEEVTQDNIEQRLHVVDDDAHKHQLLQHLLLSEEVTQAIIFSATKRGADDLARKLAVQGHSAAALHGDMNQMARNRTIQKLRRGDVQFLVATDVAARGIDVSNVSHVFNFDLPKFAEDYVHRIGRTGRAGALGTAISFISPNEHIHLKRIERYTGKRVPLHEVPGLEPKARLTANKTSAHKKKGRSYSASSYSRKPTNGSSSNFKRKSNQQQPAIYHRKGTSQKKLRHAS